MQVLLNDEKRLSKIWSVYQNFLIKRCTNVKLIKWKDLKNENFSFVTFPLKWCKDFFFMSEQLSCRLQSLVFMLQFFIQSRITPLCLWFPVFNRTFLQIWYIKGWQFIVWILVKFEFHDNHPDVFTLLIYKRKCLLNCALPSPTFTYFHRTL